jgi:hypothetical protein
MIDDQTDHLIIGEASQGLTRGLGPCCLVYLRDIHCSYHQLIDEQVKILLNTVHTVSSFRQSKCLYLRHIQVMKILSNLMDGFIHCYGG